MEPTIVSGAFSGKHCLLIYRFMKSLSVEFAAGEANVTVF